MAQYDEVKSLTADVLEYIPIGVLQILHYRNFKGENMMTCMMKVQRHILNLINV